MLDHERLAAAVDNQDVPVAEPALAGSTAGGRRRRP